MQKATSKYGIAKIDEMLSTQSDGIQRLLRSSFSRGYDAGYDDGFKAKEADQETVREDGRAEGYKEGYDRGMESCKADYDSAYEEGANAAWSIAQKIVCSLDDGGLSNKELNEIFNSHYSPDVLKRNTYREAKYKIQRWGGQREAEEIKGLKVGDEVNMFLPDGLI